MTEPDIVEIEDVTFAYDTRPVLQGISLRIRRGQVVAIMGGSGCGKTTLLRIIGGALGPTVGSARVLGKAVGLLEREELYALRRRMGMLFQFGALFTDMSVFDNVAFQMREHTDLPDELIRDLVLMKLDAVGLRGAANLMPAELSGGMARRVALARAVALDPTLIMYDEPFAGLDPLSLGVIARLIRRYRPEVVICFDPTNRFFSDSYVNHPDHRASGDATIDAVFPTARDRLTFPELLADGLEPHKVSQLWLGAAAQPNTWVDIGTTLELKRRSLLAHPSQLGPDVAEFALEMAKGSAQGQDFEFGEAFRRIVFDG